MRNILILGLISFVILTLPTNVSAGPIIIKDFKRAKTSWFYNKLGATVRDVNRDEYNCTSFGHEMFTSKPFNDGDPYVDHSGIVGSLIGGAISSGPIRGSKDDCMMSLGYRRFKPGDNSLKEFQARYAVLTEDEKNKYHGAENPPEGILARQWVNTFWITKEGEPAPGLESRNYMPVRDKMNKAFQPWPKKMNAVKDISSIEGNSDEAIIIAKIIQNESKGGVARFVRVDPKTGAPHPFSGKKGKLPTLTLSKKNGNIGDYAVFKVPPGAYALGGIDAHNMCMQTIIFKADAGSTTYLGEYTGRKNEDRVHPLAPTPRARFRFDKGDVTEVATDLEMSQAPDYVQFYNEFPYQCPTSISEKMYGVSIPGQLKYPGHL